MPLVVEGKRALVKIWAKEVEDPAMKQLLNLATLPFIHSHIAVMPDVHAGMGSTVGCVIPTKKAIIPAAVGVDIGCGMMAYRTNLWAKDLPDNLSQIRTAIEVAVPHGRSDNGGNNDKGAWRETSEKNTRIWERLSADGRWRGLTERHGQILSGRVNTHRHLGTLGTGNHFIEVCLDATQRVWVMLHSGSRGIGNRIGSYFIEKAKEEMNTWGIDLSDSDLAYLPEGSRYFNDYVDAVGWGQDFALANREAMMESVMTAISLAMECPVTVDGMAVNCHHNYVSKENHYGSNVWLTRKGAVRARHGDLGIIPGSMGAKSFIVRGKGNPESFSSCSHGAGRRMSRTEAKNRFNENDLAIQTSGVECRKDAGVLDEAPGAYKDIDEVMAQQKDLVEVVAVLKQVLCVKG